jgi:hypothetical protein
MALRQCTENGGCPELFIAGIHWASAEKVRPYRVKEGKISFEWTMERILDIGESPHA